MTSIVIFASRYTIDHKLRVYNNPNNDAELFWSFKNRPKDLKVLERVFFANAGQIIASAKVERIIEPRPVAGADEPMRTPEPDMILSYPDGSLKDTSDMWNIQLVDWRKEDKPAPNSKMFRGWMYLQ